MTHTYILVDASDAILNAILWDGDSAHYQPPEGVRAIRYDGVWRGGWKWDGTRAYDPNPPPPEGPPPDVPHVPSPDGMTVI